eukprot:GHVR01095822.1.p1 GENE.GHVR01095822.1~~GHVR01095822.1.p1  ORF type:complete len:610 (+),score=76.35 GHVR01095822.1:287-2116(+)
MFLLCVIQLFFCFANLACANDQFVYNWVGDVYILADTHGDYDTVVKLLKEDNIIDNKLNWIASKTLLIQLGDVIDIGPYSQQSMILFDDLRRQAEEHDSKVILLMGDHEYYAATDYFIDSDYYVHSEFTERDSRCYGGLNEKKKLFSNDEMFNRKYVKTLKIAVVVNGIMYSHAALNKYSINYGCGGSVLFPEKCLGDINKRAHDDLPTVSNDYYDDTDKVLFNSVPYKERSLFCEEHEQFMKAFGASVMIIGHEPQMEIVQMCGSLFFVDTRLSEWMYDKREKEHDASITSVQFKLGVVDFYLFPIKVNIQHETFVYNWEGPIFALGEIHIDFDTAVGLLKKAKIIDDNLRWIAKNTLLIQIGDVIGKGPSSNKLIRLFSDLRESAEVNKSKVILLMGNHEYSSGFVDETDKFLNKSFGGLIKRKELFSDSDGFYRMYVKSLKMAVIVNGMLFSHNVFIKDSIEYVCSGKRELKNVEDEECLRRLNQDALDYLPNYSYGSDDKRDRHSASYYESLSRPLSDEIYSHATLDVQKQLCFCKKINSFLQDYFVGAGLMFIGHESPNIYVKKHLCDRQLYFLPNVKRHTAAIIRIKYRNTSNLVLLDYYTIE